MDNLDEPPGEEGGGPEEKNAEGQSLPQDASPCQQPSVIIIVFIRLASLLQYPAHHSGRLLSGGGGGGLRPKRLCTKNGPTRFSRL